MEFLFPFALFGAVLLGLTVVPRLQARRRRAALQAGQAATFRVRLAGSAAPYPQSPRRGVLRVSAEELTWTARVGGLVLDLSASGLRPTGIREPRSGDGGGQNESVLTAADAVGTAVRLVGLDGTLANLHEVLSERAAPTAPGPARVAQAGSGSRGRRLLLVLPAALLLLAVCGAAFTTWALTTSERVTATVISEEDADAYCNVRWTDPRDGIEKVNGVDCYYDVGDEVTFYALAEPLNGEIVAYDDPWFWAVMSGVAAAGALGWGYWQLRRARQEHQAPLHTGTPVEQPAALTEDQLDYPTVSATMRKRAVAEGWSGDGTAGAASSWALESTGRAFAITALLSAWPLLLATFFCVITGWTSLAGMWSSTGETARATATVTDPELYSMLPFGPADLEVRFPTGNGSSETTLVSVYGLPDEVPETLAVEYSVAHPERVRATEYDGAALGAALSGAILLVGLGWTSWRMWQLVGARRALREARRQARHNLRYVLTPTRDGASMLLLYLDGLAPRPAFIIELADDMSGRLPVDGAIELHGRLDVGQVAVISVAGRELLTASPLLEVEASECLHLINGTEPMAAATG